MILWSTDSLTIIMVVALSIKFCNDLFAYQNLPMHSLLSHSLTIYWTLLWAHCIKNWRYRSEQVIVSGFKVFAIFWGIYNKISAIKVIIRECYGTFNITNGYLYKLCTYMNAFLFKHFYKVKITKLILCLNVVC